MEDIHALNCFMCNDAILGGLSRLSYHLRTDHLLNLTRRLPTGFVCAQNGCQRRFFEFYTLRRHIRTNHLNQAQHFLVDANEDPLNNIEIEELHDGENNNPLFVHTEQINDENQLHPPEQPVQEVNLNIVDFALKVTARFQSSSSVTDTMMTDVMESFEEFSEDLRDNMENKIKAKLQIGQVIDENILQSIDQIFNFENPFKNLKTIDQRIQVLKDVHGYIEPSEIKLGRRQDSMYNKKAEGYIPTFVDETYEYVSVTEVLKLVLSNKHVRQAILSEQFSPEGILGRTIDGQYFKNHPFFSKYRSAIRLKLYYDEFEIVNPIGSKTGIHKIGVFYYIVDNLPPHMNSQLSSIHTLAICSHQDVLKYKFQKILNPFFIELEKLETDKGIELTFEDGTFVLRASIFAFCGDGLAVHEVFNLLGPSANKFCRMCLYSREDLHAASLEKAPERTRELFAQQIDELKRTNYANATKTFYGVQGECCLNRSNYFHCADNKIFDIMHDFLNGLLPMLLKLVLNVFINVEKKFDVAHLNSVINTFNYGYVEHKNKPSANFTNEMLNKNSHTLSQKAMQIWLLVRALPFILSDKVDFENEYMDLILHALRIMEIVFAPKIPNSLLPYLNSLIEDFIQLFHRLFPDVNLINKHHHLQHYVECIRWAGPLIYYWCMRFEAQHGRYKAKMQKAYNFQNPPKTLIRTAQAAQSARWGGKNVKLQTTKIISSNFKRADNMLSREELLHMGYGEHDLIISPSKILINGIEFSENYFVILETPSSREDKSILFGKIKEISYIDNQESNIYLLTSVYESTLDPSVNAYRLHDDGQLNQTFTDVSTLPFNKTFCSWRKRTSDDEYICLRHIVF